MLRQLISKWGIMSTEMQQAFSSDMTFEDANGTRNYVESDEDIIDMEQPEEPQAETEPTQPAEASQDAAAALFGNK